MNSRDTPAAVATRLTARSARIRWRRGAELLPALVALMRGDRWLAPAGAPVVLKHRDCGETVHAALRCEAGHEPSTDDLELAVGPGRLAETSPR
jgi:hypothetical protein